MSYKWAYCLNEKQYNFLIRLAGAIPHFMDFMAHVDSDDLLSIIMDFRLIHQSNGISLASSHNLAILEDKYEQYREEYNRRSGQHVSPYENVSHNSLCTWNPLPRWATNMDFRELDYLSNFISQVPGLVRFLQSRLPEENLYDLVEEFKRKNGYGLQNDNESTFILNVIQELFYNIMEHHENAIHYVNHKKEINDASILEKYIKETKDNIFLEDNNSEDFRKYLSKYIREENPYIQNRLFRILFRSNQIDLALYAANKVFIYAFSSPNRYWHNREAVYGCADTIYSIVDSLGPKGMEHLRRRCPKTLPKVLNGLYHLLSRIIYWTDMEMVKNEFYDDTLLPINVQHKLRAYRLRANLVEHYGSIFLEEQDKTNEGLSCLSDLMSAHIKANGFGIVGDNSLFKQEAVRIFHTRNLFQIGDMHKAAEKGFKQNDDLSKSIHTKYLRGYLSIETPERNMFFRNLQSYYSSEQQESLLNSEPLSYLVKDNYSPAYKGEKEIIRRYLSEQGVRYFYHFTEKDKIGSIIRCGGLMSSKRCLDEGVVMPIRKDMALSRDIDAKYDLEDFARLSFCPRLPKLEERKKEGAELVLLLISTEVALFEETQFTDMEATHDGFRCGKMLSDLRRVHIDATQREYIDETDPEYWYSQAEILVKGLIPLKFILNIKDPIKL